MMQNTFWSRFDTPATKLAETGCAGGKIDQSRCSKVLSANMDRISDSHSSMICHVSLVGFCPAGFHFIQGHSGSDASLSWPRVRRGDGRLHFPLTVHDFHILSHETKTMSFLIHRVRIIMITS